MKTFTEELEKVILREDNHYYIDVFGELNEVNEKLNLKPIKEEGEIYEDKCNVWSRFGEVGCKELSRIDKRNKERAAKNEKLKEKNRKLKEKRDRNKRLREIEKAKLDRIKEIEKAKLDKIKLELRELRTPVCRTELELRELRTLAYKISFEYSLCIWKTVNYNYEDEELTWYY